MMEYPNVGLPGFSLTVPTHIHTFEYSATINLLIWIDVEGATGYLRSDYGVARYDAVMVLIWISNLNYNIV